MKAKVSLNGASLRGFLLAHGEKIGVGVVILGFCFLVYRALGVESYQRRPEDLAAAVSKARQHIDRSFTSVDLQLAIDKDTEGTLVVRGYDKIAETTILVDPRLANEGIKSFRPPSNSASTRRPQPELLALEELRAEGSNGTFALLMTDEELDARERERMLAAQDARRGDDGRDESGRRLEGPPVDDGRRRGGGHGGRDGAGRPIERREGPYDNLLGDNDGRQFAFGLEEPEDDRPEPPLVRASGDAKAQGFRWVVLTGLVPMRKQAAEFRAKFEDTGNYFPDSDHPLYVHFDVERAEVVPGQAAAQRNWRQVDVMENTVRVEEQFDSDFPMDCDEIYLDEVLTRPLPPLLSRNWGDGVVHKPEIEMLKLAAGGRYGQFRGRGDSDTEDGDTQPEAEANQRRPGGDPLLGEDDGLLGGSSLYNGSRREGDAGRTNRRPRGRNPYSGGRTNRRVNPYGNRRNNRVVNPYGPRGGHGGEGEGGSFMSVQSAEYALFRFFDYAVESGKSYVYRVRLKLMNPNFELPSHLLESGDLAKAKYADTPWTELADTVKVPGDNYLLAGEVTPSKGANEPKAKVIIENFDIDQGLKASEEFILERGDVAGVPQRSVKLIDPITREIDDKKLDFDTDTVVLDMIGGERLGVKSKENAPGMLLLLDETGNLVVREELSDKQDFDAAKDEMDRIEEAVRPPRQSDEESELNPYGLPRGGRRNRSGGGEDS